MADSKPENGLTRCAEMAAQVAALQAQVNALEAKLAKSQKHSGNSSKPPSSDIVKPPRKSGKKGRRPKRKIGGQPGHDRHERTPFSPHELDEHWLWHDSECPCCGGGLRDTEETGRTIQQIELMEFPVQVTQHTAQGQWCPTCQKSFVLTLPEELRKAGLVGARLTALVGFLKGACHMSYSTIRKYFRDVQGVTISRTDITQLQQIPNVGPSIAANLRLIGITVPQDLLGKDPYVLYEELCRITGTRHDPCVIDVFISAVRFMAGEPAQPWWKYTAQRKEQLAARTKGVGGGGEGCPATHDTSA